MIRLNCPDCTKLVTLRQAVSYLAKTVHSIPVRDIVRKMNLRKMR
jgi:hypothetical protein